MKQFKSVVNRKPGKAVFDLSHEVKLTADMGKLIPVLCQEVYPGDYFNIGIQALVRMLPLVAPVMHQIDISFHTFFCPYRKMWNVETDGAGNGDWTEFITGGEDGANSDTLPTWSPSDVTEESLWDYLGFPAGITPDADNRPLDFPKRAYNWIFNDYYRDENVRTEVDITTSEAILYRSWEKGYLESCLPWQQRGTAPALPISGSSSAVWGVGSTGSYAMNRSDQNNPADAGTQNTLNNNTVDLSSATTFDVADLRLAFQIQKWMERNARTGARYTESLKAHFGVSPRDERLQRPEYIGGSKSPIVISEVLQTSEDGSTPQGNLAGHGITAQAGHIGKYKVKEHGLIMTIMSIMPKPGYQQGINRQWSRQTRYDFYWPEFANLSEQAILRKEVYANNIKADNETVFGYQGRYDELRFCPNRTAGEMRSTYQYWHLNRIFASAPALNTSFIEASDIRKDIFAAPSEPGFIVTIGNIIKAVRCMPTMAEPGLIDH